MTKDSDILKSQHQEASYPTSGKFPLNKGQFVAWFIVQQVPGSKGDHAGVNVTASAFFNINT